MTRRLRHIVVWLFLAIVWLGAAADGTGRLKNYDIWKDLPSETIWHMGSSFFNLNRIDSALLCYNILTNRYHIGNQQDSTTLRYAAMSMNQLSIIYTYYFIDYEKAQKYLLQAEKIAKKNDFIDILSAVYNNISNVYLIEYSFNNNTTLDNRIIECLHKSFEFALEAGRPEQILASAFNIAHVSDDSMHFAKLRDDIIQFLHYQLPDSVKKRESTKYLCLAMIAYNRGNYEDALSWHDKALEHLYHPNPRVCEIMKTAIYSNKCRLLVRMQQYQRAINILNEKARIGKNNNDHNLLFISFLSLSEYYYEVQKDSIMGGKYELMALREKDIMLNQNKLLDAEKVEFLFQIDEINAEVQELTYRQKLTKYIAWSIAAITLIILGFLYLLWRKYKQEQKKNRILYEKNQAWLAADEERRQRIIAEQQATRAYQLEEGERSDLLHRVFIIMETNDEVFSPDFTLPRLAELVDDTRNNVSEAINQQYHTNFNTLVNEYRIKEACRRINDEEQYGNLTIEAIGQSLGFKSNSNFVSNFKRITGLTPSAYRKQGNAAPVSEPPSVPPKEGEVG